MRRATATVIIPPETDTTMISLQNDDEDYQLLVMEECKIWHEAGYVPAASVGKKVVVDLDDHNMHISEEDYIKQSWFVKVVEFNGTKRHYGDFPMYVNKLFLCFRNPKQNTIIDNE